MRRLALAVSVPLLTVVTACGGNGGTNNTAPSPSATSASPSASPSPVTAAELDAMLLTAADLGAGWTAGAPEDPDDNESPSPSPSASAGACTFDSIGEENVIVDRSVEISNAEQGTFINHEVEAYESGGATASIGEARELFTRCKSFTETDDEGGTLTLTVSPFNVSMLGDETLSYKLTAEIEGQPFNGAIIVFRKGDHLSALMGLSATAQPESYLISAATKAAAKLR